MGSVQERQASRWQDHHPRCAGLHHHYIEHPKLVAQSIVRYAELVSKENVIAGSDCGFGTFARTNYQVEPEIVWVKFRAMAEGARLASEQLWPRSS